MSSPIIEVTSLSKAYRLGQIGSTTLKDEIQQLWRGFKKQDRDRDTSEKSQSHNDLFWALKDVSFSVEQGNVLGIIGKNGAGKSTLLKILSRITEPTSGEAIMRGRVASLLEVGTGFHPDLTGRDNIYLNGAFLGMTKVEINHKFHEIVDFSGVEKFIDTPVKRYSSGMYVRLAFAVAAHLEPEILIIDEVLAVGDQDFQRKCIGKMQSISSAEGRTILFVSHYMAAVRRLCDKCLVLHEGKASAVMEVEKAIEIYTQRISESELDLDLREFPRSAHSDGKICRIERIRIQNSEGLLYRRAVEFIITLKAFKAIKGGMVGLGFNALEGNRILTLDSDCGDPPFSLTPGLYEITLKLDRLPLHPGFYACSASIATGAHFYDIILDFANWEVKTSKEDNLSDRGVAGVRLQPEVNLRSL